MGTHLAILTDVETGEEIELSIEESFTFIKDGTITLYPTEHNLKRVNPFGLYRLDVMDICGDYTKVLKVFFGIMTDAEHYQRAHIILQFIDNLKLVEELQARREGLKAKEATRQ